MRSHLRSAVLAILPCALLFSLTACQQRASENPPPIVGAWVVTMPGAPFPMHMYAFHADGTVVQSNPDAGDPRTSDSNLMGAWVRDGDGFRVKMVEFNADRTTHKLAGRVEISYQLKVQGDALSGTGSAVIHDADDHPVQAPINFTMQGRRITP